MYIFQSLKKVVICKEAGMKNNTQAINLAFKIIKYSAAVLVLFILLPYCAVQAEPVKGMDPQPVRPSRNKDLAVNYQKKVDNTLDDMSNYSREKVVNAAGDFIKDRTGKMVRANHDT